MTDKLITKEFFDPMFQSHGLSDGTVRPHMNYLQHCRQSYVAIDAMLKARDAGELARLPDIEGFAEGKAWNDIVDNGTDASDTSKYYASTLVVEGISAMVEKVIDKYSDSRGNFDQDSLDAMAKVMGPLASKIDKWLAEPKQHQNENRLPRSTAFMDRTEENIGVCYLVQMNGWDDVNVMIRSKDAVWERAPEVEDDCPTP